MSEDDEASGCFRRLRRRRRRRRRRRHAFGHIGSGGSGGCGGVCWRRRSRIDSGAQRSAVATKRLRMFVAKDSACRRRRARRSVGKVDGRSASERLLIDTRVATQQNRRPTSIGRRDCRHRHAIDRQNRLARSSRRHSIFLFGNSTRRIRADPRRRNQCGRWQPPRHIATAAADAAAHATAEKHMPQRIVWVEQRWRRACRRWRRNKTSARVEACRFEKTSGRSRLVGRMAAVARVCCFVAQLLHRRIVAAHAGIQTTRVTRIFYITIFSMSSSSYLHVLKSSYANVKPHQRSTRSNRRARGGAADSRSQFCESLKHANRLQVAAKISATYRAHRMRHREKRRFRHVIGARATASKVYDWQVLQRWRASALTFSSRLQAATASV